jgi:hypothetical protein
MKTFQLLLLFILLSSYCFSQTHKGNIGLSVSLQNEQIDFLVPIFVSDNLSLSPAFGVRGISDKYIDLTIGSIIRYYFSEQIVSPFIGGRFGALLLLPKDDDSVIDYVFGPLFGGEYYFNEHISLGIEVQFNIVTSSEKSMRFGNPGGTNFNTATAIFATIYF